ncbi:MAG TPA: pentapeptide repeat-containing protein [Ignavibacteriaceae bacterium]|nr:pentapeptide repeat-containing protein [Ignavibacteriaceae bacterium]
MRLSISSSYKSSAKNVLAINLNKFMNKDYSKKNLQKKSFQKANLSCADFSGSELRSPDFTGSDFSGAADNLISITFL